MSSTVRLPRIGTASREPGADGAQDNTVDSAMRDVVGELFRRVVREELSAALSAAGLVGSGQPSQHRTDRTPVVEGLWDTRQAAEFLRVSDSWIYHRASAGSIPCVRVGHNLRFDPDALRAWVRGERRGGRVVPLK